MLNQISVPIAKKIAGYFGYRLINANRRWGVDHIDDIQRIVGDLSKIRCVFDVGANVGANALAYATRFPNARILAFEPVFESFGHLKSNSRNIRRILPIHCALGNHNGISQCSIHADSRNNTLVAGLEDEFHSSPSGNQDVQVVTLDTFVSEQGVGSIDLLKIDTEGYDLAVLQGASETLRRKEIKFVYFEFHHLLPRQATSQLGSLISIAEFLDRFDFRFLTIYTDSVHGDEPMGTYNALFLLNSSEYSWRF